MPIATITLNAGETFWVPKTATLLSVDVTDGLVLQGSDCIDTTAPAKLCYKLAYTYTEDDARTGAWDAGDGNNEIIGIYINGTEKPCAYDIVGGLASVVTFIEVQSGGSITNVAYTLVNGDPSDKDTVELTFSAPKTIGDALYFRFQIAQASGDPLTNIRVYAEEIDCVV